MIKKDLGFYRRESSYKLWVQHPGGAEILEHWKPIILSEVYRQRN